MLTLWVPTLCMCMACFGRGKVDMSCGAACSTNSSHRRVLETDLVGDAFSLSEGEVLRA